MKTLTVFGAAGVTGQEVVREAVSNGWHVKAVEPDWSDPVDLPPGVERVEGDVLSGDLAPALEGAEAVISALGVGNDPATLIDPPPLYTEGTLRIVQAMKAKGIRRLVVISASFVAARDRGPLHFRLPAMAALKLVFRDMANMERILRATEGIDWTAVRPGWLMDGPATGDYTVSDGVIPPDMIRTRHADLAHFMVALAGSDDWVHGTPAIARHEPDAASSPAAVLRDMIA